MCVCFFYIFSFFKYELLCLLFGYIYPCANHSGLTTLRAHWIGKTADADAAAGYRPTTYICRRKKKFPFPSEFYHQKMSRKITGRKMKMMGNGAPASLFPYEIVPVKMVDSVSWIIEMLMRIRSCCQSGLGTREKCHEWVMDDSGKNSFLIIRFERIRVRSSLIFLDTN